LWAAFLVFREIPEKGFSLERVNLDAGVEIWQSEWHVIVRTAFRFLRAGRFPPGRSKASACIGAGSAPFEPSGIARYDKV
jgi:hypothetical protein